MAPALFGSSATLLLEASQQGIPQEKQSITQSESCASQVKCEKQKYKWNIVWRNVIAFIYIHAAGLYGLYLVFTKVKFASFVIGKFFL